MKYLVIESTQTPQQLIKALQLDKAHDTDKEVQAAAKRIAELLKKKYRDRAAETVMDEINRLMGGYGVENIEATDGEGGRFWQDTVALYVNMGDTYTTTVVYDVDSGSLQITSMGDWIENCGLDTK